jgi:hypothetical protein
LISTDNQDLHQHGGKRKRERTKMKRIMSSRMMLSVAISTVVIIGMLLAGFAPPAKTSNSGKDILVIRACIDFERMVEDTRAGILTNEEIRERAKEIRTTFQRSYQPNAQQAGDHLLRAMTGRTSSEELSAALQEVVNVCR